MSDLSITTREIEGVVVLTLDGAIALGASSAELNGTLRDLVHDGQRRILLNLAAVRRIDSSGLGTLVAGFTTVGKNGGQLKLSNVSERVFELMTMTKLHTVFDIFENEEIAVQSFEQTNGSSRDTAKLPLLAEASSSSLL